MHVYMLHTYVVFVLMVAHRKFARFPEFRANKSFGHVLSVGLYG